MKILIEDGLELNLTPKRVEKLMTIGALYQDSKLWNGEYDTVDVSMDKGMEVKLRYSQSGKAGYMVRKFHYQELVSLCQMWITNPILNKSGLASKMWSDNEPNKLRRRLEQKVQFDTLTPDEKKMIVDELEEILHLTKKSLEIPE